MAEHDTAIVMTPTEEEPAVAAPAGETKGEPSVDKPKTTDSKADTGAGDKANAEAVKTVAEAAAPAVAKADAPDAPEPTEARPAKKPRVAKAKDTDGAVETAEKPKRTRAKKTDGEGA